MFGFFKEKDKSLPVAKAGSKKLQRNIDRAMKASDGNCVECKNHYRHGEALFCKKCLKKMWGY